MIAAGCCRNDTGSSADYLTLAGRRERQNTFLLLPHNEKRFLEKGGKIDKIYREVHYSIKLSTFQAMSAECTKEPEPPTAARVVQPSPALIPALCVLKIK